MRSRILAAVLLGIAPTLIQAKNPTILIKDPPPPTQILTGDTFGFGADALGGGVLTFQNATGQDWTSLTVTATLPDLTQIDCIPGPFFTCSVATTPVSGGFLYNILFGPASNGGIPNGSIFGVNLNDPGQGDNPDGAVSWGAGTDFDGKATPAAPEPASWLLMAAGMLLISVPGWRRSAGVRAS